MPRRKPRPGEYICRCGAYRFPHRMMGGACNGLAMIGRQFEQHMYDADCRDCILRVEVEEHDAPVIKCQVVEGQEHPQQCPVLQDHIRFHGIKLYGENQCPTRARRSR